MKILGNINTKLAQGLLLAVLFMAGSFSYAETSRDLVQDETRVILAVENMT